MSIQKANRKLDKLIALMCSHSSASMRFFGVQCASMVRSVTDTLPGGGPNKTMATNGAQLFVNADFLLGNSDSDNLFVLAHEAFHKAARHSIRLRDCAPGNQHLVHMAADYAVNLAMEQDASVPYPMPKCGLLDHKYVDDDGRALNVERILRDIMDNATEVPVPMPGDGDGDDGTGELLPAPADLDDQQIAMDNIKAEAIAGSGDLPGHLKELVKESSQTAKSDWMAQVRAELCKALDKSDYSLRKPNQRYLHTGVIMPSLRNPAVRKLAVAIDTSGSMSESELNIAAAQLKSIVDEFSPLETIFLQHDAKVTYSERLVTGQKPTPVQWIGRGGTKFKPILDWLESEQPDGLLWITDMGLFDTIKEPDYPVIWLSTHSSGNRYHDKIGFGRYIPVH